MNTLKAKTFSKVEVKMKIEWKFKDRWYLSSLEKVLIVRTKDGPHKEREREGEIALNI